MNKKKALKNPFYLLLAVLIIALSSCGEDEEGKEYEPETAYHLNLESTSYDLTQDGSVTLKFSVEPVGIEINTARISINNASGKDSPIKITGLSEDNGTWKVQAKVTDFTRIEAIQTVKLITLQNDKPFAEAEFTLNDPYAINEKYGIAHPQSINYRRTDDNTIMKLPIIITATKAEDLEMINNADIKIKNNDGGEIPADRFTSTFIKDEKGILLVPQQKTINELLEDPLKFKRIRLSVWITGANGRSAHFLLSYILSSPCQTLTDEKLTVSVSELKNPGFSNSFSVDAKMKLRRLGFIEKDSTIISTADLTQLGFYDANGNKVEENFMKITPNTSNLYLQDVSFSHDPDNNTYTAGLYNYKIRYTLDWKYNDKTYPRIYGDLQYVVTLK